MARKGDKTTIIFVSKNQSSNKPIQVSSTFVQHWKKYVLLLCGCFISLLGVVFYLAYTNALALSSNDQLAKELQKSKNQISVPDTLAIKQYYQSIDKKLAVINKYLKARGVKSPSLNEGGEKNTDLLSVQEISQFYNSYLDKMVGQVAYTPIGYPHFGVITSGFGHRENPFSGGGIETHKGLDFRGRHGEIVKSTASGKVVFAGRRGGYGKCVVINHGNGFETYYGHLSRILIKPGQTVSAGEEIGKIGSTGRSTGPHLHYEIHRNGNLINPKSFLTLE